MGRPLARPTHAMLRAMGKHWHDLASWWTRHPSWQAFIYFLICAILALFTDRVKSVITAPVRVSWNWLSIRAEKSVRNDLAVIKWVHNNPYNLLLYLAESAVDAVVWSAFISLAVNAYSIGLALFFTRR
jgi:hypothetical protein